MIGVLKSILCVLRNVLLAIAWAGVEVINLLVAAIGALASGVLALLPEMPDPPDPPDHGVLQWLSWLYPLPGLLAIFATVITLYLAVFVIRIALRWVKAL